jgi:hypothetical protein
VLDSASSHFMHSFPFADSSVRRYLAHPSALATPLTIYPFRMH